MDRDLKVAFHFLLLLSIMFEVGDGDKEIDADINIIDAAKRLFSSPPSCLLPTNLDFRTAGSRGNEEATASLKDAVLKSFQQSTSTVEDTAKSVATTLKHKLNTI
ncbi:uncharacterized protein LOC125191390 [Salvia hispanica]|uniref:uncharacterized protein LOC125191390 n=1 Tax=Salvia hispanica TaxID=49212 RepID=UPI0020092640|nr:uncharacterized protein LOC125191390 [Salvia hispanica]